MSDIVRGEIPTNRHMFFLSRKQEILRVILDLLEFFFRQFRFGFPALFYLSWRVRRVGQHVGEHTSASDAAAGNL